MRRALITGINGQDGSYLAELLLAKGYEVYGVVRRSSIENSTKLINIKGILERITIKSCSLENSLSVYKLFQEIKPDECYHLAASSFVSYSLEDDMSIMANNFTTTHNILLSAMDVCPNCHIYFAGSSEIFGNVTEYPQNENTPYNPRSVYGISKMSSHCLVKNYRERYGLFACTGFTYNHESPRRGRSFVTRKITSAVAAISLGRQQYVELGNIEARRDWGYAPEYVEAMYKMLQAQKADDYVIATGHLQTIKNLLEIAFGYVNLDYRDYVRINEKFVRPDESVPLVGDYSKIQKELDWKPELSFKDMIEEMVECDLRILRES